tara:strand:+ start:461 stop:691 length:231 start_codon:yes stop_codon:yes gene_type:complete
MSRYTKEIQDKKGNQCNISWGFDHVLGYWYTIQNEDMIIEEWNSDMGGSRSTMLEFLIKYELPKEHRSMVALDYPF